MTPSMFDVITESFDGTLGVHRRVVHGSDGPAGRVGSGRIGSGRFTILPDFGGSSVFA